MWGHSRTPVRTAASRHDMSARSPEPNTESLGEMTLAQGPIGGEGFPRDSGTRGQEAAVTREQALPAT